jgi:class 3 adenylate cyclase/tetratricopeptide (TPR) repeat protein
MLNAPFYASLDAHLSAAQRAQLNSDGDLPAAERAALALQLRAQLAAAMAFIPARLAHAQLANPQPGRVGGAFWHGSLLFADLSGFTALSEKLSVLGRQGAEEVSAIISQVFDNLLAEIAAYQGTLLKFGGDALTAFFDADTLGESHPYAAAAAALAMQQGMASFDQLPTRAGVFRLGLRVGVHSGRVFAAEVGDTSHIELVVTGAEVNRVALAQEIASPGEVVVTERTAALLADATLEPRDESFLLLRALPPVRLPPPPSDFVGRVRGDTLTALDRLATQLAAVQPYLVRKLPRRFLETGTARSGEFRPVTVLFANFYDFSAILDSLCARDDDPAIVVLAAQALNAYYRRAQALVHHYGGIVNKVDMYTHGDKLMALFGAPSAHEDDPLRAVRCALELEDALAEANQEIAELLVNIDRVTGGQGDTVTDSVHSEGALTLSPPHSVILSHKIGINTGTVFAGRVGGAARYEYTVMGPAVNLAARLMSAAPPATILLSPATRAVVAGAITVESHTPLQLKGIARPVVPGRALGVAVAGRSSDTDRGGLRRGALIGRDSELTTLLAASIAALRGSGRVIAVVGEAGSGKSRLAEELAQRLVLASREEPQDGESPDFQLYFTECQGYDQRTPYAAIRPLLYPLLGIGVRSPGGEPPQELLAARVRQLASSFERFLPLLGDVLNLPLPESALTASLSPQQRHDRLQELIVALFRGATTQEALLLSIEDVHWADSSSLEVLGALAATIGDVPLLLLLNYRPEPPIDAPWSELSTTLNLRLGELLPEACAQLLSALLGTSAPPELLALLDRTQGNPYFIEQLVLALIDAGALTPTEQGWQLSGALDDVQLPTSIEGLLQARLDQLDERRHELVQIASVIGRRFESTVLAGVYDNPESLDEGLRELIAIEVILAAQQERELAYLFRHALLRDVAYEGILYSRRRDLHRRVATCVEMLSRGQPDAQLARLAYHYLQAEVWQAAFEYQVRAGVQARQRYANADALAFFRVAAEIAPRLEDGETPAGLRRQAEAHEQQGDILLLLGEYDDADTCYRAALLLLEQSGQRDELCLRLLRLRATVEERRSNYAAAFAILEQGMAGATSAMRGEMARCYLLGAGLSYRQARFAHAMEWARIGLRLTEELDIVADQAHALLLLGNIYSDQSETAQAIEAFEQARVRFQQVHDLTGLANTLNNLGTLYLQVGRWQDTVQSYEQSLALAESVGDVLAMARTSNNLAVALVGRDQLDRAAELYRFSSEQFARMGSALGVAVTTYNRGEVLLLQGQPAAALELFQQGIANIERINARTFLPEVLRLAAEAALDLGDHPQAYDFAVNSRDLATELGMSAEVAVAERVLGRIALRRSDFAAAADLITRALARLEVLDNRYELGKTLLDAARLSFAVDDHVRFKEHLARARTIFQALDAQRDLAEVERLSR